VSRPPFDALNLAAHVGDDPDAVAANRELVRRMLGADDLVVLTAAHGADVVSTDRGGPAPEADAVIVRSPGLGVLALGADCVTLALAGDDDTCVAAVHCGWRGLVSDVVGGALRALADLGAGPGAVVVGPAICGACYPVPPERIVEVRDSCAPAVAAAAVVRCPDGQPGLDVRAGVLAQLAEWGADGSIITHLGGCTAEDADLFSHRRHGRTGRQGLAIVRHA